MEGHYRGFLATGDASSLDGPKDPAVSTCLLDASSEGCAKSPDGEHVAWLDDYRDQACRMVRYPDASAIPGVGTLLALSAPVGSLLIPSPSVVRRPPQGFLFLACAIGWLCSLSVLLSTSACIGVG